VTVSVARPRLHAISRAAVTAAIGGFITVTVAAATIRPPAVTIADRYLTLAAILMAATVLTTLVVSEPRLERPGRLIAVMLLLATAMGWYGGRRWIHERQFDDLAEWQEREFELRIVELSGDILNFLHQRGRTAPPAPEPRSWDHDVDTVLRYEQATSLMFEAKFGPQVRKTREILALYGFADRDLDAFYRQPANAFQINVVASELAILARRLNHNSRAAQWR
jgi:hypothetical protein